MKNERLKIFMGRHRSTIIAYFVMLVVLILFACYQQDFFTKYGPQSVFNQVITLCIATLGQTIVILTSGIDLSVGSLIVFLNCVMATIMQPIIDGCGGNTLAGVLITCAIMLVMGAVCGMFNGVLVVYGRLQPIVVTLATGSIFSGLSRYVRPSPGGKVVSSFARFMTGRVFDYIPMSAIVLLAAVVLIWLPYRSSRNGQALYAIGGNESAAYLSGIKINQAKLMAYIIAGLCSGLNAILLTAQIRSGDPTAPNNFTNNSIAAAALGGVALSGGKGSYFGAMAGAIILSLIVGLLIFWKISSFYQNLIQGVILILALSVDVISSLAQKFHKRAPSMAAMED